MPSPPAIFRPPENAAELLDGLLSSQLYAESIFGTILEQSSPHLDVPAAEFATSLVQMKILTRWQAGELLAGRLGMYAGTYRLLERLVAGPGMSLFVAEQVGRQRLVLLQVGRISDSAPATPPVRRIPGQSTCNGFAQRIETQATPHLRITAYDFQEAVPLASILAGPPLENTQRADLLQQFAGSVGRLSAIDLESLGPESALMDHEGVLRLLAEPVLPAGHSSRNEPLTAREKSQIAAIRRFATCLGGVPEIDDCHTISEIGDRLFDLAEPWSDVFATRSRPCSRSRMNRHLRKGPSQSVIEKNAPQLQVALTDRQGETPPLETPIVRPHSQQNPAQQKPRRTGSDRVLIAAFMGFSVAGLAVIQWFQRWGVGRADAAVEPQEPEIPRTHPTPNVPAR